MAKTIEEKRALLLTFPEEMQKKLLEQTISGGTQKEDQAIELEKQKFDSFFNVQAFIISAIAAKNSISLERMLYDLNTSFYKQLNKGNIKENDFKYPSELPLQDNIDEQNEYYSNIPKDEIIVDESGLIDFKNNLLKQFGIYEQEPDKLLQLLKKLKKINE